MGNELKVSYGNCVGCDDNVVQLDQVTEINDGFFRWLLNAKGLVYLFDQVYNDRYFLLPVISEHLQ